MLIELILFIRNRGACVFPVRAREVGGEVGVCSRLLYTLLAWVAFTMILVIIILKVVIIIIVMIIIVMMIMIIIKTMLMIMKIMMMIKIMVIMIIIVIICFPIFRVFITLIELYSTLALSPHIYLFFPVSGARHT